MTNTKALKEFLKNNSQETAAKFLGVSGQKYIQNVLYRGKMPEELAKNFRKIPFQKKKRHSSVFN